MCRSKRPVGSESRVENVGETIDRYIRTLNFGISLTIPRFGIFRVHQQLNNKISSFIRLGNASIGKYK